MRVFSTDVLDVINSDFIEYFILVEMNLSNSDYFLTTNKSNVTDSSGNVFLANGAIFEYDSPRQNSVLDREAYKIQFIDPSDELFAEFKQGVINRNVTIRAGFIHPTLGPLTGDSDLVYVYSGYIDAPSISTDFNSKIVEIECSSPMADFDMVRPFFTTSYGMDQINTEDTSFDRINEGFEMQIDWGKI
jgi:hypothetical protein